MKRKLILLSGKTFVVSIPSKWAKKFDLKKGEDIELIEKDNTLIINPEKTIATRKITVNITKFPGQLIWMYLFSIYTAGHDEIHVVFENEECTGRTGEQKKTIEVITNVVERFMIGMEIVKQSPDSCTINEISIIKGDEFELVLKRIFHSISSLCEESLAALKNKDMKALDSISEGYEKIINKFACFCQRVLNRTGYKNEAQLPIVYSAILELEELADHFNNINCLLLDKDAKTLARNIADYEKLKKLFMKFYEIYYAPKMESILLFWQDKHSLKKEVRENYKTSSFFDIRFAEEITSCCDVMNHMVNSVIAMKALETESL
jgi:phosphate uptake regulator